MNNDILVMGEKSMKNTRKGIRRITGLAVIAVIGFAALVLVGCAGDDGDGIKTYSLNGTWYTYGNVNKYIFNNGSYEHYYNGSPYEKGTYTTTNDSMTMTITHIGSSRYSSSYTWLDLSKT